MTDLPSNADHHEHCPLCHYSNVCQYHVDNKRHYYQCQRCKLVFVDPSSLPSITKEKAEYDKHQNDFDDLGYIRFLSKVLPFVKARTQSCALDYGCGPSPVLACMLKKRFSKVTYFDPIYFANVALSHGQFDFIACTEAVEHFHSPAITFHHLVSLMSATSELVIMTKRVISPSRFANWHYKNDPTHVSFFSEDTFRYIGTTYKLDVSFPTNDIALFSKPSQ